MNDEGDISPSNLSMIAPCTYIGYTTIELIALSVTAKTKIGGAMEILFVASEFSSLYIRHIEEHNLIVLGCKLKYPLPDFVQFNEKLLCFFSVISIENQY